jgi:hypothetical protein
MKFLPVLILGIFFGCNSKRVYKELARTDTIDSEIVLINIANNNRSKIATLLMDIEKSDPLLIGINVLYINNKEDLEDSMLTKAFEEMSSDILAYEFGPTEKEVRTIDRFRKFARDEGFTNLDKIDEEASHFTTIKQIRGRLFESFALKIIKRWKPNFKYDLDINKSIPILFQRSLQQFYYFAKEDLKDKNVCDLLKKKVVLVGFLGPGEEDKYYTPMGKDSEAIPDTYGLVTQANAIRTILQHNK